MAFGGLFKGVESSVAKIKDLSFGKKNNEEEIIDLVDVEESTGRQEKLNEMQVMGVVNRCLVLKGSKYLPKFIEKKQELSRGFIGDEDREQLTLDRIKFNKEIKDKVVSIENDIRDVENSAVATKYSGRVAEMRELRSKYYSMLYNEDDLVSGIRNNKDVVPEIVSEKAEEPSVVMKIAPETSWDMFVIMRNYEASIKSLEFEVSVLENLIHDLKSNIDSLQVSIYSATLEDIKEQIASLDKINGNDGFVDLDKEFDRVKARFDEMEKPDIEELKEELEARNELEKENKLREKLG